MLILWVVETQSCDVPVLVNKMGLAYPELNRAETLIRETLELEENRLKQMLDRDLAC